MTTRIPFFLLALLCLIGCRGRVASEVIELPVVGETTGQAGIANPDNGVVLRIALRQGSISDGLRQAIPAWEAQTGVTIELHNLSHSFLQKEVFTDVEEGKGKYDVILIDDPWFPSLAENGYLIPLSTFDYQPDPDFLLRSLELAMWPPPEGPRPPGTTSDEPPQLYALPLIGNVQLFWFNREQLTQTPTSMDNLVSALSTAANPANGLYSYAYTGGAGNPIVTEFNAWNWSYGGAFFDEDWNVIINDPTSVEALTDWLTLLETSSPSSHQYRSSRHSGAAMLNQEAIGALIWPANIPNLLNSHPEAPPIAVIPLPTGYRQTSQIGHWLLAIPTTAQNKQEAYNFILWATSQEIMAAAAANGLPPTRQSVFSDDSLVEQYPWFPATEAAIHNATWRPRTPHWTKIEHIMGNYLIRAAEKQLTPQEALDQAAADIERVMLQAGYYD